MHDDQKASKNTDGRLSGLAVAEGSASSELPAGTARACPFCGCPRIGAAEYPDHKGGRVWMVFCGEGTCSARVLAKTKDRALAKWEREPNTVDVGRAGNGATLAAQPKSNP